MLVLSRKECERIKLGDSIVVTVLRLGRDKVRLGIEAPDDVVVLREELEAHEERMPEKSEDSDSSATRPEAA
jgi:carbon storage regulator